MRLDRVWLTDVRSYESAELELAPGLTALLGDNGQGKTNVLEAIGWLATLASFRGAPTEALIRQGAERAVIRAEGEREGRADPHRGGAGGVGSQPGAGQPAAAQAGAGPARRAPRHRVRARRPRAGQGRPGRAPALPRRRPGGVPPPLRRPARRGRQGPQAAQRPAQGRRRSPRRRAPRSPSTCGTPSSSSPAGAWPRPARPCSTAWRRCWPQTYDAVANRPAEVTAAYVAEWAGVGPRGGAGGEPRRDDVRRGVSTVGPAP